MRKFIILLIIAAVVCSLSACAGTAATTTPDTTTEMVFGPFEWPDTSIAKLMPIPKSTIGNISWSENYGFVIYVAETTQEDFDLYAEECAARGFTENVNRGETWYYANNADGYHASIQYQDNNIMFVRIDEPKKENAEAVETSEDVSESMPEPSEIVESSVAQEPTLVLEDASLYYTTNSLDIAKKGNAGVFSYQRSGSNYDCYWIIDFDEGYAFFFTYGNGNGTCDRVRIDGGDLNTHITVTYHDGDSTWQYGLCFKWANQPDRLIQTEPDGTQYEFVATDLSDALKIRDTMVIVDY